MNSPIEIILQSHGELRVFRVRDNFNSGPAFANDYLPSLNDDVRATAVRRLVRLLMWMENPRCRYCGRLLSWKRGTIDHSVPRSRGGDDRPSNLVLSCRDCNGAKGSLTPEEWTLNNTTHHEEAVNHDA